VFIIVHLFVKYLDPSAKREHIWSRGQLLSVLMVELVLSQCENFAVKEGSIFCDLCRHILWTAIGLSNRHFNV